MQEGESEEIYRNGRMIRKPPPPKPLVRAEPLRREKLATRRFADVVAHSIERPKEMPLRWWVIGIGVMVGFLIFAAVLGQR